MVMGFLSNAYAKFKNKLRSKKGQRFVKYLIIFVLVAVGLIGAFLLINQQLNQQPNQMIRWIGR